MKSQVRGAALIFAPDTFDKELFHPEGSHNPGEAQNKTRIT